MRPVRRGWARAIAAVGAVALLAGGCADDSTTTTTASTVPAAVPSTSPAPSTSAVPTATTTTLATVVPTVVDDVLRGESEADRYTYELTFPQVRGLADPSVQDAVNAEIRAEVTAAVDEFVTGAKELPAPPPALADQRSGLDGAYEVARLDDRLASFRVRVSRFFAGAAHPGSVILTFNHDVRTGRRLVLTDLFAPGSSYLTRLSELSRELLFAQPGFGDLTDFVLPGTEPEAENFDRWSLGEEGLIVMFDEYQVAPYAMGTPSVTIPYASLRLLLDPVGPLAIYN